LIGEKKLLSSLKNSLNLQITSQTNNLMLVRDFISDAAKNFGFDEENVNKITLAVDEACTNIIKHAYNYQPDKPISLTVFMDDKKFIVIIKDNGKYFKPESVIIPNVKEHVRQYKVGGLGIYLMKSLMDEVKYKINPGNQNEVTLIKYLPDVYTE
jgi:serine/threonine-protein kinase RsbW